MRLSSCALGVALALVVPATAGAVGAPDPSVPAARDTEPVVLTGSDFPGLSVPANQTVKVPFMDLEDCQSFDEQCAPNHYAQPEIDTAAQQPAGPDVNRLLGYRWQGGRFHQIPFQVDEVFTRYLDNSASGFAVYSGEDQHTTYPFDREGFRYNTSDPSNPCLAVPDEGIKTTPDPVRGLDDNDELAFMASDAGGQAPAGTPLPRGIQQAREVRLTDPSDASATRYVYVMVAAPGGPVPAFDAANGYVHYQRDANADTFEKSESSYEGYGNAARGKVCDANGNVIADNERRRPRDYATVTTPRYRFRYDGRWLMTQVQVARRDGTYGPDLVDRWKARAFAQDPDSNTPCCGFEEEDTNWGGSSTLLGEKTGPVRAIRETWGADSGTNVIRRETFYRDQMIQKNWLRVHVIPPLDGIYAQWDFNAGRVNRFYNAQHADGVPIDGRNDEVYGNFDDPCSERWDGDDSRSDLDTTYRQFYRQSGGCDAAKALEQLPEGDYYHQSMDPGDLTFGDTNAALGWSQISGPNGTIVDRIKASPADATPGGAAQSVAAMPYYRDDACFDDGPGSAPGPELHPRHFDQEQASKASDGSARRCWDARKDAKVPAGDDHFWQGDIGTHGLHLLFLAESDNARMTVPLTEIVSEWQMVMLKGDPGNVGERYGRSFEKPLVPLVQ